jgi:ribosomal-protein-alanine N-acetyltransferase
MSTLLFAGDAAVLAALHAASFAQPWSAQSLRTLLATQGTFALVDDDPANGFILARVAAEEAEILTLAVHPPARRKGLGLALVAACGLYAQNLGATEMFLEVEETNQAARGLYERLGFRVVGGRKAYYARTRGDALILRAGLPFAPLGKSRQLD